MPRASLEKGIVSLSRGKCRCRFQGTIFLLAAFFALAFSEAGRELHRPCEKEDLPGTWEMVGLQPPLDLSMPLEHVGRYQLFFFSSDGTMKTLSADQPIDPVKKDILRQYPSSANYYWLEPGRIELMRSGASRENMVCAVCERDVLDTSGKAILKKGDLFLISRPLAGRKLTLHRQLRRIRESR